jgi:hypothetical protein
MINKLLACIWSFIEAKIGLHPLRQNPIKFMTKSAETIFLPMNYSNVTKNQTLEN